MIVLSNNLGQKSNLFFLSEVLFGEYQQRRLKFHEPLADTSDGLHAFELKDYDEYVLCFGKPILSADGMKTNNKASKFKGLQALHNGIL